ncbi:hypothetical protein EJ08DRAFT_673961 [Tothia fuscella]|uniref:Cytidyltransferase-like domain-containing protein n=1 Tax=Tothia fuscella TaxID=1048955 RepID=A0A9P4P223_9PEZI|nr:hypothetical protein EJ08DRAFT_673961 [Tothia fuscella]
MTQLPLKGTSLSTPTFIFLTTSMSLPRTKATEPRPLSPYISRSIEPVAPETERKQKKRRPKKLSPLFAPNQYGQEPMLLPGFTNRILLYVGSFNPPHRGHFDFLERVFKSNPFNVAAIVLPLSCLKHKFNRTGEIAFPILSVEERKRLWQDDGLKEWYWTCTLGIRPFRAILIKLKALLAEDGFDVEFDGLLGPDHVSVNDMNGGAWYCEDGHLLLSDQTRAADFVKDNGELLQIRHCSKWEDMVLHPTQVARLAEIKADLIFTSADPPEDRDRIAWRLNREFVLELGRLKTCRKLRITTDDEDDCDCWVRHNRVWEQKDHKLLTLTPVVAPRTSDPTPAFAQRSGESWLQLIPTIHPQSPIKHSKTCPLVAGLPLNSWDIREKRIVFVPAGDTTDQQVRGISATAIRRLIREGLRTSLSPYLRQMCLHPDVLIDILTAMGPETLVDTWFAKLDDAKVYFPDKSIRTSQEFQVLGWTARKMKSGRLRFTLPVRGTFDGKKRG